MALPYPSPHRSWINLGIVAYHNVSALLAPSAVSVASGGTGTRYKTGDVVALVGGSVISPATFTLTVDGSGNVTAVTLKDSGHYTFTTANPSPVRPTSSTAGGSDSGLKLNVTWPNVSDLANYNAAAGYSLNDVGQWLVQNIDWFDNPYEPLIPLYAAQTNAKILDYIGPYDCNVSNARVASWASNYLTATLAGGYTATAYQRYDVVTVQGGTYTTPAQFVLLVDTSGSVTSTLLRDPGSYTSLPSNPVSVSGGNGSGLTLNLTSAPFDPETLFLHYYSTVLCDKLDGNGQLGLPGVMPDVGIGIITKGSTTAYAKQRISILSSGGIFTIGPDASTQSNPLTVSWSGNTLTSPTVAQVQSALNGVLGSGKVSVAAGAGVLTSTFVITWTAFGVQSALVSVNSFNGFNSVYLDGTPAPMGSRVPTYTWSGLQIGLPYKDGARVVCNVGNPKYQERVIASNDINSDTILANKSTGWYRGVMVDNANNDTYGPTKLGTIALSGTQTFADSGYAVSGVAAGAAAWASAYTSLFRAMDSVFGMDYEIYPNQGDGAPWNDIYPYITGTLREFGLQPGGADSGFQGQVSRAITGRNAGIVCFPTGQNDTGVSMTYYQDIILTQFYLCYSPGDIFGLQNSNNADPMRFFDFGLLDYNVGTRATMPSGKSPLAEGGNERDCYLFATGDDPSYTGHAYHIYARNYDNALVLYKTNTGYPRTSPSGITVALATVASQGSGGYTNGDIVTAVNNSGGCINAYDGMAQFKLTVATPGGPVTAVAINSSVAGTYHTIGSSPVSVTGGTGSGLTLYLTATAGTLSSRTGPHALGGTYYRLQNDGAVDPTPMTEIYLSNGEPAILVKYLTSPATVTASQFSIGGPTGGQLNAASSLFSCVPSGGTWPPATWLTPASSGAGNFSPATIAVLGGSPTFTYTPTSISGSPHVITVTTSSSVTATNSIDFAVTLAPPLVISTPTTSNATSATLKVSVIASQGTPPYTQYQWYRNGSLVATTTVSSFVDSGLTASTTYYYTCTVTDSASNTATSAQGSGITSAASGGGPVLAAIESTTLGAVTGTATAITSTLTLTDVGSSTIASATVSLSPVLAEDTLAFSNTATITGVFAAGTLTLTGTRPVAEYQAALRAVTYKDTNLTSPSTATRTVSFRVNDGTSSSNTVTRRISVTVPPTPVLASIESNALSVVPEVATAITSTVTLVDGSSTTITSATVTISSNYVSTEDLLHSTVTTANTTWAWDNTTGILTVYGIDTLANYQAILRGITYKNTNTVNPDTSHARTVGFKVYDGITFSNTETRNVSTLNAVYIIGNINTFKANTFSCNTLRTLRSGVAAVLTIPASMTLVVDAPTFAGYGICRLPVGASMTLTTKKPSTWMTDRTIPASMDLVVSAPVFFATCIMDAAVTTQRTWRAHTFGCRTLRTLTHYTPPIPEYATMTLTVGAPTFAGTGFVPSPTTVYYGNLLSRTTQI